MTTIFLFQNIGNTSMLHMSAMYSSVLSRILYGIVSVNRCGYTKFTTSYYITVQEMFILGTVSHFCTCGISHVSIFPRLYTILMKAIARI